MFELATGGVAAPLVSSDEAAKRFFVFKVTTRTRFNLFFFSFLPTEPPGIQHGRRHLQLLTQRHSLKKFFGFRITEHATSHSSPTKSRDASGGINRSAETQQHVQRGGVTLGI